MFMPAHSVNLLVAASVLGGMAGLYAEKDQADHPRSRLPDIERPFPEPAQDLPLRTVAEGSFWH